MLSVALLLGLLLNGCLNAGHQESLEVELSFYHWKSSLQLKQTEWAYLEKLKSSKLYVKFFDVDWNPASKQAIPVAPLKVPQQPEFSLPTVVPVVFITNRTLIHLPDTQLPLLAEQMTQKIQSIWFSFPPQIPIQALQIDCDWTETTRAKYFRLLELLQQSFDPSVQWSATIRLHQIKYFRQTGVPPVDRGMLMCYNTGDVRSPATQNSILDSATLQSYLFNFEKYPLSLDLALPVFRWGVLFRDDRMIRLINGLTPEALADVQRFRLSKPGHYEVLKGTFLQGHYLYAGDDIRLESIEPALLQTTVQQLKPLWPSSRFTLAFYQLDSAMLEAFPPTSLEQVRMDFEQ